MSFSRVNSGGWATGAELTSAQLNQMDTNLANALDKSTAGDFIAGVIGFVAGTGKMNFNIAGCGEITTAGGLVSTVAFGFATSAAGGIALGGGTSDEIQYTQTRTKLVAQAVKPLGAAASGWTIGLGTMTGPANGNVTALDTLVGPHQGATLSNVRIYLHVNGPHSQLPAVMPELQVHRRDLTSGGADVILGDTIASAANAGAWDATTFWDIPCNLGGSGANLVDRTKYVYYLLLVDENGTGSVAGNIYNGIVATYSGIGNMGFA